MVERYGDFVLYRPPFKASTAILWIGPFALAAIGALALFAIARRRGTPGRSNMPGERRAQIEALLEGESENRKG